MILSITLILPKALEPFFEQTVYSYLNEPLQIFHKDIILNEDRDIIYIIYNENGIQISQNYKEVLDIDTETGGFNLQVAWSTGHLAGVSAASAEWNNAAQVIGGISNE